MSQVPYAFPLGRWGARMNNQPMVDLMIFDGLLETFYGYHMGLTAENIAERTESREKNRMKSDCSATRGLGRRSRKGSSRRRSLPSRYPRKKESRSFLRWMKDRWILPLKRWENSERPLKRGNGHGWKCIGNQRCSSRRASDVPGKGEGAETGTPGRIVAYASAGVDPPIWDSPNSCRKKGIEEDGLALKDIGLIELNEAFAAQAIACIRELQFDLEKTNVTGAGFPWPPIAVPVRD